MTNLDDVVGVLAPALGVPGVAIPVFCHRETGEHYFQYFEDPSRSHVNRGICKIKLNDFADHYHPAQCKEKPRTLNGFLLGIVFPNGGIGIYSIPHLRKEFPEIRESFSDFPFFLFELSVLTGKADFIISSLAATPVTNALRSGVLSKPTLSVDLFPERGWTDKRVEALVVLWNAGYSANEIAKILGGVTRNAIIGKIHRMGLMKRADSEKKSPSSAEFLPQFLLKKTKQ